MIRILPLTAASSDDTETLLDAAFGLHRRSRTAYQLREKTEVISALSFAAFAGDRLVGTLQSWPVAIAATPLILVGPVAVAPVEQRRGIGKLLMTALTSSGGDMPLMMIGDPEYYGRFFDFTANVTGGWDLPGPFESHRLLARGVKPGLIGMVVPRFVNALTMAQ